MNLTDLFHRVEVLVAEERTKFLRKVDPEIRKALKGIPVRVILGRSNRLYGDYSGTAFPEEKAFSPFSYPSDITLYARSFLDFAEDDKLLRKQVRMVLTHEYGHYLGFSEKELRERGL